jgi:hypothetical protein
LELLPPELSSSITLAHPEQGNTVCGFQFSVFGRENRGHAPFLRDCGAALEVQEQGKAWATEKKLLGQSIQP